MMTKDKKPFTYTPGGIDLSEIKSPRMARRIERNANAPGVGELQPAAQQQHRPLPPSALAAMQPALPVQVFPTGMPPPPPPPPPPAFSAPGPPAPPLPTKPVATNDGIYERPDMTRIIPENPMAMLRKTPKVERRTFLDELNDMERKAPPPANHYQPPQPSPQYTVQSPQYAPQSPLAYQPYAPPPPPPQSPQVTTPNYNRQPSYTNQPQPYVVPQMVQAAPQSPQPPSPMQRQPDPPSPPMKTSNVSIGSLYIAPVTPPVPPQRQQQAQQPQSPPTPQSPIPKLNAAPKPWQNQRKEPELPEWAQRQPQPPQSPMAREEATRISVQQQPPSPSPRVQQQQQQYHPQQQPLQQPPPPRPGVEVVWVTQPEVYQHPGQAPAGQRWVAPQPQQQQQQQRAAPPQPPPVEMRGTRIIPIQIEGQHSGPNTPDRSFNRQQSWTPTQSNSFKTLQKMTNTDNNDDDDDDDAVADHYAAADAMPHIEYGPRTAQQFPADMMARGGGKQVVYLNRTDDEDPRYRGGHIPSRVFRYLDQSVPQSPNQRGPTVRTIPIQLEGDASAQQAYVHPSQQTVEEPRKYMGSAIPSRAFRMVQAMNANSPAAGNNDKQSSEITDKNGLTEICDPPPAHSQYAPYPANPNYYDPYWYDYYAYYYPNYAPPPPPQPPAAVADPHNEATSWGYHYPSATPTPTQELEAAAAVATEPPLCSSCRNTPVPFWGYPYYNQGGYESDAKSECSTSYRNTPANFDFHYYWDPYYYSYYPPPPPPLPPYGYPPYYPSDGYDGYCSTDEMASINAAKGPVDELPAADDPSDDGRSETTLVDDRDGDDIDADSESSSEEDEEVEEIYRKSTSSVPVILQLAEGGGPLPSKTPIQMDSGMHETDEDDGVEEVGETCSEATEENEDHPEVEEVDEEEDVVSVYIDEDQMPHVLSIIYEESERSFSSRMERESSVASTVSQNTMVGADDEECEVEADQEEEEEEDTKEKEVVEVKLPLTLTEDEPGNVTVTVDEASATLAPHSTDEVLMAEVPINAPIETEEANSGSAFDTRSRSNSSHVESSIEIHMDDDRDSVKSAESEIKPDITTLTHLPEIEEHQDEVLPPEPTNEQEEEEEEEEEEIDFWSQINNDEDEPPRRQVFYNKYRDSIYSVDENDDVQATTAVEESGDTRTTIEEAEGASRTQIASTKDTHAITTITDHERNAKANEILSKREEHVVTVTEVEHGDAVQASVESSRRVDEHQIFAEKLEDVETTVDVVRNTLEEQVFTVGVHADDECIRRTEVDERRVSNVTFTKEEIRETLRAPIFDLGLDECFKSIQNHLKLTLEGLTSNSNDINILEAKSKSYSQSCEIVAAEEATCAWFESERIRTNQAILSKEPNGHIGRVSVTTVQTQFAAKESSKDFVVVAHNQTEKKMEVVDTRCARSRNRSGSRSKSPTKDNEEDVEEKVKEEEDDREVSDLNNNNESAQDFYVPTIKERIRALQNASRNSTPIRRQTPVIPPPPPLPSQEVDVHKDYLTPEPKSPKTSTKSSVKSVEDNSEDEIDSGVTSDMSRHISDTESECVQEIRKTIKYQRAATHSRLYKLLQGECDDEDEEEEEEEPTACKKRDSNIRKESLSLPLKTATSVHAATSDESGFNSPASPITDRLVNDLIAKLLRNKHVELKNVSMEMLQAAACKILEEDRKEAAGSYSLIDGGAATAAQTPQEFYTNTEYSQYYETWENAHAHAQAAAATAEDIPSSKSFRRLQEMAADTPQIPSPHFTAKCPLIASAHHRRVANATPTNHDTPPPPPEVS